MNHYDAIVIGSGAGGGVMAYRLSQMGLRVLVVERGRYEDPTSFEHNEMEMIPRIYKHGGLQTTADHDVAIMQGCTVGGSTVINNAIWLRPNLDRVLPEWKAAGAELDRAAMEDAYDQLEELLHVTPIAPFDPSSSTNEASSGAKTFLDGAAALGMQGKMLRHNRKDCIGCGWCNYGCRYNRKLSMLVTTIPWAEQLGATVLDSCQNVTIRWKRESDGKLRAEGIDFTRHGKQQTATADAVVACAGAIGSSALLLGSGITANGQVGRRFHALGGVILTAQMPSIANNFDGIGLTSLLLHDDPEIVMETFFAPPGAFSITLPGWFATHIERMERYRYFAQAGVMVATPPNGSITLDKKGNAVINLKFGKDQIGLMKKGMRMLSDLYFAAGAVAVFPGTFRHIDLYHPNDFHRLDQLVQAPDDLILGSAHPQGGSTISRDPATGVVGQQFRVHGFRNLFVADASLFPTNIRANCQATVMALSWMAASHVAQASS